LPLFNDGLTMTMTQTTHHSAAAANVLTGLPFRSAEVSDDCWTGRVPALAGGAQA
jgi:hypothetical protein